MLWRDPGIPADSYYEVRPECTDVPKTKFKIKAGKTLSVRRWQAAFTPEGSLDIGRTLSRIHRGEMTLRPPERDHPSVVSAYRDTLQTKDADDQWPLTKF